MAGLSLFSQRRQHKLRESPKPTAWVTAVGSNPPLSAQGMGFVPVRTRFTKPGCLVLVTSSGAVRWRTRHHDLPPDELGWALGGRTPRVRYYQVHTP